MHFTTLFILKGEKIEDLSSYEIEDQFCERFCYCCGETKLKYKNWCDWFEIGGRWCDPLKAKKGFHCKRGWSNDNAPIVNGEFAVAQISDLTEELPRDCIYAVATKSRIYLKNEDWASGEVNPEKFDKLLDEIDSKKFDGVIALIDCHD